MRPPVLALVMPILGAGQADVVPPALGNVRVDLPTSAAMKPRPLPDALAADGRVRRWRPQPRRSSRRSWSSSDAASCSRPCSRSPGRLGVGVRSVFRHFSGWRRCTAPWTRASRRRRGRCFAGAERGGSLDERVAAWCGSAGVLRAHRALQRSGNLVRWRFAVPAGAPREHAPAAAPICCAGSPGSPVRRRASWRRSTRDVLRAWERLRFDRQLGTKAATSAVETSVLSFSCCASLSAGSGAAAPRPAIARPRR